MRKNESNSYDGKHGTNCLCIIVEPFFIEATGDVAIYNSVGNKGIANAIVKGITGQDIPYDNNPASKVYVVTEYLLAGYRGNSSTSGIDVNDHMCGIRWELRSNSIGQWAVTELLDPVTVIKVKESLGSWSCEYRTSNK